MIKFIILRAFSLLFFSMYLLIKNLKCTHLTPVFRYPLRTPYLPTQIKIVIELWYPFLNESLRDFFCTNTINHQIYFQKRQKYVSKCLTQHKFQIHRFICNKSDAKISIYYSLSPLKQSHNLLFIENPVQM